MAGFSTQERFMLRNVIAVFCAFLICGSIGCGPPEVKPPPSAQVKGTITLNGSPLPTGEVVFSIVGQPPKTLTVTNGAYAGEATVGKNKVEVHSYKESAPTSGLSTDTVSKEDIVADQFGYQSTLTADVQGGGANEFNFDVKSK